MNVSGNAAAPGRHTEGRVNVAAPTQHGHRTSQFGSGRSSQRLRSAVTYKRHNCTAKHRTYLAMAKCIWKKGYYPPMGEGQWVAVHKCRRFNPGGIVRLFPTQAEAHASNVHPCGGACKGRWHHDVVRLELPV